MGGKYSSENITRWRKNQRKSVTICIRMDVYTQTMKCETNNVPFRLQSRITGMFNFWLPHKSTWSFFLFLRARCVWCGKRNNRIRSNWIIFRNYFKPLLITSLCINVCVCANVPFPRFGVSFVVAVVVAVYRHCHIVKRNARNHCDKFIKMNSIYWLEKCQMLQIRWNKFWPNLHKICVCICQVYAIPTIPPPESTLKMACKYGLSKNLDIISLFLFPLALLFSLPPFVSFFGNIGRKCWVWSQRLKYAMVVRFSFAMNLVIFVLKKTDYTICHFKKFLLVASHNNPLV